MDAPCEYCRFRPAARRGLCEACWQNARVRGKHLARLRGKAAAAGSADPAPAEPSDADLDDEIERMLTDHPLWKPCPYHPTDPRYNRVVAEREAAGLPCRHPGDLPPSLD